MKKSLIILSLLIVIDTFVSCTTDDAAIELFNGQDLTGWEIFNSPNITADGNCILTQNGITNPDVLMMTDRNFDNFDLTMNFRQIGDGDFGVYFHSSPSDHEGIPGWSCSSSSEKNNYFKQGRWNTLRLRVMYDHVQMWLNDNLISDHHDTQASLSTGRIMLKSHSDGDMTIKLRNLKLIPLGMFETDPIPRIPSERTYLFNGENLDGWDVCVNPKQLVGDPDSAFMAEDGIIKVGGICLGGITTKEAWRDYKLHMEFRFAGQGYSSRKDRATDGGLLFHCVGPEGSGWKDTWHLSFEANIIQGRSCDLILVESRKDEFKDYHIFGKGCVDSLVRWNPDCGKEINLGINGSSYRINSLYYDPSWKDSDTQPVVFPEKEYGQWNELELICDEDRAQYFLNGHKMLEFYDLSPSSGRIQLQSELHYIEYRNIYIEPIR